MKLRPATSIHGQRLASCGRDLHNALSWATVAGCPKLCAKIRVAISSFKGARRHMRRRMYLAHQLSHE